MRPVVPYDDISDVNQEWNTDQPENSLRGVEHESHRPNDGKVVNAWRRSEVSWPEGARTRKYSTPSCFLTNTALTFAQFEGQFPLQYGQGHRQHNERHRDESHQTG